MPHVAETNGRCLEVETNQPILATHKKCVIRNSGKIREKNPTPIVVYQSGYDVGYGTGATGGGGYWQVTHAESKNT